MKLGITTQTKVLNLCLLSYASLRGGMLTKSILPHTTARQMSVLGVLGKRNEGEHAWKQLTSSYYNFFSTDSGEMLFDMVQRSQRDVIQKVWTGGWKLLDRLGWGCTEIPLPQLFGFLVIYFSFSAFF